tara:strand:- start:199 stop:687 length:489 start_codon:yes stop_codon:yes gene_type:complete
MKKAFVFDFDDTLAMTDCKVVVKKQGKEIARLTPAEYNNYTLTEDCYFDYDEFRDPSFIEKAEKLHMMDLAKEVHDENHDVFILTARGTAVADAIDSFLWKYNIDAKQIHCLGDTSTNETMATAKTNILATFMMSYDKVYFYDDNKKNVEAAESIGCKSYKV